MPLYLHSINRILRDMRIEQQVGDSKAHFKYSTFKKRVSLEDMTPAQLAPLQQRLDALESFMHASQVFVANKVGSKTNQPEPFKGNDWTLEVF